MQEICWWSWKLGQDLLCAVLCHWFLHEWRGRWAILMMTKAISHPRSDSFLVLFNSFNKHPALDFRENAFHFHLLRTMRWFFFHRITSLRDDENEKKLFSFIIRSMLLMLDSQHSHDRENSLWNAKNKNTGHIFLVFSSRSRNRTFSPV